MRHWGVLRDGDSPWRPSIGRNKRPVSIDLRTAARQDLMRKIATSTDVIIENFRPCRLAEWGPGYAGLSPANPALIMAHASGYGQTGPRAGAPGFGSIGQAVGGPALHDGHPGPAAQPVRRQHG